MADADHHGVTIRAASGADRPALEAMMAALQEVERATEPNRRPGPDMAAPHMAALLDWADADPAGGCLVAERWGKIVGFVLFATETEFGDYVLPDNRVFGTISDLYVEPEARGAGIASRLVAAAETALAAGGVRRVAVTAVVGNTDAIGLYETLGYAPSSLTLTKAL